MAYSEAIRLKPDDPGSHTRLGTALQGQGKLMTRPPRTARRGLKLDDAGAYTNLGAPAETGKLDDAIAAFAAIRPA